MHCIRTLSKFLNFVPATVCIASIVSVKVIFRLLTENYAEPNLVHRTNWRKKGEITSDRMVLIGLELPWQLVYNWMDIVGTNIVVSPNFHNPPSMPTLGREDNNNKRRSKNKDSRPRSIDFSFWNQWIVTPLSYFRSKLTFNKLARHNFSSISPMRTTSIT